MNEAHTSTAVRTKRRRHAISALLLVGAVLATASCSGSIARSYRSFQSALDRGASCSELFDQRAKFHNEDTLAKIDRDLARIGCTSPGATRTDR